MTFYDEWHRVTVLGTALAFVIKARDPHDAFAKFFQCGIVPFGTKVDVVRTSGLRAEDAEADELGMARPSRVVVGNDNARRHVREVFVPRGAAVESV